MTPSDKTLGTHSFLGEKKEKKQRHRIFNYTYEYVVSTTI